MLNSSANWQKPQAQPYVAHAQIADAGWLPKSRQVGQSGKVVGSCKLYVALGVSGSIQHMAGMKHVPTIVAVNTDPGASIFTIAKYGIVADIFEIEEELNNQLAA